MTTNVLFMCPHSAGKSLAAATYFRAAAARSGLDVSISIAGTDPDEVNMPNVVAALADQGHTIRWSPTLVTAQHTEAADLLVSVGCDHELIPTDQPITDWQVPMISEDLLASLRAIHEKAEALALQLGS